MDFWGDFQQAGESLGLSPTKPAPDQAPAPAPAGNAPPAPPTFLPAAPAPGAAQLAQAVGGLSLLDTPQPAPASQSERTPPPGSLGGGPNAPSIAHLAPAHPPGRNPPHGAQQQPTVPHGTPGHGATSAPHTSPGHGVPSGHHTPPGHGTPLHHPGPMMGSRPAGPFYSHAPAAHPRHPVPTVPPPGVGPPSGTRPPAIPPPGTAPSRPFPSIPPPGARPIAAQAPAQQPKGPPSGALPIPPPRQGVSQSGGPVRVSPNPPTSSGPRAPGPPFPSMQRGASQAGAATSVGTLGAFTGTSPPPSPATTQIRATSSSGMPPQQFAPHPTSAHAGLRGFPAGGEGFHVGPIPGGIPGHVARTSVAGPPGMPITAAQRGSFVGGSPSKGEPPTRVGPMGSGSGGKEGGPREQVARLVPRRMSGIEVAASLEGLALLARQGSWRAIVDKVVDAYKYGQGGLAQQLSFRAYHVLALMKLGMYGAAAEELGLLGDLDSPQHRFEAHPGMYPGRSGSMLPFALRFLHAELPQRTGNTQLSMDRLYALRAECVAKAKEAKQRLQTSKEDPDLTREQREALRLAMLAWRRREKVVEYRIIIHHIALKDYPTAVSWLQRMILRDPLNPHLLSKFGYLRLQTGDVDGAKAVFALVDEIIKEKEAKTKLRPSPPPPGSLSEAPSGDLQQDQRLKADAEKRKAEVKELHALALRNSGLVLFAEKKYKEAGKLFDKVLDEFPADPIATNNKALCMMYGRDLVGAVRILEEALQMTPLTTVNETLVLNLCSMYELASTDTTETKRALSNWLTRLAPDDFDYACTRM